MNGSHFTAPASDPDFQRETIKGFNSMMVLLDVILQGVCRISANLVGSACPVTVENRCSTEESSDGTRCDPSLILVTRRSGKCMEIHIKDNASGVPPDTIERMFHPFVTTKPPVQSTGLCLALSSTVNCRHGCEIRAEPEPGAFIDMIAMPPAVPPSETGDGGITNALDKGREHIT